MKKILSLILIGLMIFGLVSCSNKTDTEKLFTIHGMYFKVDDQNLLITPSGRPFIFTTNDKVEFKDGDKIQFNYDESKETYPEQVVAKNIKYFNEEFKTTNIANTMKFLKSDCGFNFNDEIYLSLVKEDDKLKDESKSTTDNSTIDDSSINSDIEESK